MSAEMSEMRRCAEALEKISDFSRGGSCMTFSQTEYADTHVMVSPAYSTSATASVPPRLTRSASPLDALRSAVRRPRTATRSDRRATAVRKERA